MYYASEMGAALDTNLVTGGGTDDTTALNNALSQVGAEGGTLVVDGPGRISAPLVIHSNTRLQFPPGAGLFLTDGSNCPLIWNANRNKSARTDHDIEVVGGYFNGNGDNQSQEMADGTFNTGITFYGATRVRVRNAYLAKVRQWAVCMSNVDTFEVGHIVSDCGDTYRLNTDAVNVRGPASNGWVHHCVARSGDDAIALNSKDYSGQGIGGPYLGGGDISNVVVEDIILDGVLFGVGMYSTTYRIDQILVRNVQGRTQSYALHISTDNVEASGDFGNVLLDGLDVETYGTPWNGWGQLIRIEANCENVALRNVQQNTRIDYRPVVYVDDGFVVNALSLSGFTDYDELDAAAGPRVSIRGQVQRLAIADYQWFRDAALDVGGSLVAIPSGSLGRIDALFLNGITVNRATNVVNQAAGTLSAVQALGIRHEDAGGGATFQLDNGTVDEVLCSNWSGATLLAGSATVTATGGDAFA